MLRNEDLMRDNVLAAGALKSHDVPGVVDLEILTRHDQVDARAVGFGIGASEQHPIRMIDAAAKLPSSVDAETAADRGGASLPRERAGDQAVAAAAEDFILRRLGKRTHAPVMRAHYHEHPPARWARLRGCGHRVGKNAERKLV